MNESKIVQEVNHTKKLNSVHSNHAFQKRLQQRAEKNNTVVPNKLVEKLDKIDQTNENNQSTNLFVQIIEDKLEIILEKLENERKMILSHGLMKKEVVDVKLSVQKEIEIEKL